MRLSLGLLAPLTFVLFLTFGGFLARCTQPFEIFSHFRMHLAAAALTLAFALLAFRQARAALCALAAVAANVAAIGWALAAPAPIAEAQAPAVRVLWGQPAAQAGRARRSSCARSSRAR